MSEDGLADLTSLTSERILDHERITSNDNHSERKYCPNL